MVISDTILNFWYFTIGGLFFLILIHEVRKFLVKRYEFQFYMMQFHNPKTEIVSIGADDHEAD